MDLLASRSMTHRPEPAGAGSGGYPTLPGSALSGRTSVEYAGIPGPFGPEYGYPTLPRFRGTGRTERDGNGTGRTERDGTERASGLRKQEAGSSNKARRACMVVIRSVGPVLY